jgi:hypothetical protein
MPYLVGLRTSSVYSFAHLRALSRVAEQAHVRACVCSVHLCTSSRAGRWKRLRTVHNDGIEAECVAFSHSFARVTDNRGI